MNGAKNILDQFRLDAKVAVVTGASRGLGKAMATALAAAGADVALLGRDETTLAPVARELEGEIGRRTAVVPLDVADPEAHAVAVEAILARLGQIDILVNNAGINVREEALNYPVEAWDQVTD